MFVSCTSTAGCRMFRQLTPSVGRFFVSQSRYDVIGFRSLSLTCQRCVCASCLSLFRGAGRVCSGSNVSANGTLSRKCFPLTRHHLRFCSGRSSDPPVDANKEKQQQPDKPILPPPTIKRKQYDTPQAILIGIGICAVGCLAVLWYKRKRANELERNRQRSLGKAALGGKFSLIDHNKRPCSSDDLLGQWVLLYFGFTHCPDVCPDELEKISAAVDNVNKWMKTGSLQPVFITVDPHRDTPEAIASYVKEFHPKFLGLTGTPEQVKEACKAYRVYFSEGPKDDDNDYIVDHTIITYLIDPEGKFVDYYGQTKTAKQISDSIIFNINKHNQMVNTSFW